MAHARKLADPRSGLVRIGVSPLVGISFVDLVIEPFRRAQLEVEVIFRELNLSEMVRLLDAGQLDFVFGPIDPVAPESADRQSALFLSEPLVFVPGSRSRAGYAQESDVGLQDIADETFVMVPDSCGLTGNTRALFALNGLTLREYPGQALSYGVLQEWADLGIGSAILPRSKLRANAGEGHLIRARDNRPVLISYQSLWRREGLATHEAGLLAAFLRDVAPAVVNGLHRVGSD